MDSASTAQATQPNHTVKITFPEAHLATLRSTCAEKAKVSLLGRIQGKHPGLKALTAWARDTLHPSFSSLLIKANNLFEISFSDPEGRIHALTQTELLCDNAVISFASWRPHFDANTQQDKEQLDYPVWLQVIDLSQVLRDDTSLRTIGAHIGQVIAIDNSEAYRSKLFGPRIRILVRDINNLPKKAAIPKLDGEGEVEYNLEYNGLPHQCARCRALDHHVRQCPRRYIKFHRRDTQVRNTHTNAAPATQSPTRSQPTSPTRAKQLNTGEAHCMANPQKLDFSVAEALPTSTERDEDKEGATTSNTQAEAELEPDPAIPPDLQPNDTNFPLLTSPEKLPTIPPTSQPPGTPNAFVWKRKSSTDETPADKGKSKLKTPSTDSAPFTRQGYRSGRLAEDFWEILNISGMPDSARKKLRILPILTRNHVQTEYLVDINKSPSTPITTAHVAEQLTGVPWTLPRVKEHIIREVSQALHKVLIFNNQSTSPIYQWDHGRWFSHWNTKGNKHICTIYVSIKIQESKLKFRKGRNFGWKTIPKEIQDTLVAQHTELIQDVGEGRTYW